MEGPSSHVNPHQFVPPTVPPLTSPIPSSTASKPRSEIISPSHQISDQPLLSPDPPPPPPPPPTLPNPAAANPDPSSSSLRPAPSSGLSPSEISDPLPQSSAAAPAPPPPHPISLAQPSHSTISPDLQPSSHYHHLSSSSPSEFPPLQHPHPRSQPSPNPVLSAAVRSSGAAPVQQSYAQAARQSKGPGFIKSHANEVESFARLPRTGVNIVCGARDGAPSFSFVNSELPKVEELYANALVMKFHGGRPSLVNSQQEIRSWGIEHPFSIGPLTSRAFLLRFQANSDLLKVLTRPSSTLITFPYKIFRWHNLCHLKEDSCFAPIWISLPRLPLQCFVPEFLEAVANKIGRFLCLDKATATLARPSTARLCVEIDLREPLPQFIWIGLFDGVKQPIIYEKMPQFCKKCFTQGHSSAICPKGQRETPIPPPAARARAPRYRTQPARRNAEESTSTIQQQKSPPNASHTSSHIPSPPNNPPHHPPPPPNQRIHQLHGASAASAPPHQPTSAAPATNPDHVPPHIPPTYPNAMPSPAPQLPAEVEEAHHLQSATNPAPNPLPIPPPSSSNATSSPTIQAPAEVEVAHHLQSAPTDTQHKSPPPPPCPPHASVCKSPTPSPSSRKKDQHKRKSVSFDFSQLSSEPRMEANAALWDAVKHRISTIEQTCTSTSGTSQPHTSVKDPSAEPAPSHVLQDGADSELSTAVDSPLHPPTLPPKRLKILSTTFSRAPMIPKGRSPRRNRHPWKAIPRMTSYRKHPTALRGIKDTQTNLSKSNSGSEKTQILPPHVRYEDNLLECQGNSQP